MSETNNLNNIFISGWGGYKELLPSIAEKTNFYVPFIDPPEIIKDSIKRGGKTLMGWSTGAHIISKDIPENTDKWENIVLIAPFSDFTKSFGTKILDAMIKGLHYNFYKTMNLFYQRCGIKKQIDAKENDASKLITGLEFLKTSRLVKNSNTGKITVIYGTNDQIVKKKEILYLLKIFNNSHFTEVDQPHFINENILSEFL